VSKAQAFYWLSLAVVAVGPLALMVSPLGFFDGPRGD
jgi:hypothetical protein